MGISARFMAGYVDVGQLSAGNHSITFRHSGETAGSAESMTYLVGLCTATVSQPPTGSQGCTPGYWKQDHHFDSWRTVSPSTDFDNAFGLSGNPTGNATLLSALNQGGGGQNALMRHAAAALLNSYSISFSFTTDQVKAIVQNAFASRNFEAAKNQLAGANERTCPLN